MRLADSLREGWRGWRRRRLRPSSQAADVPAPAVFIPKSLQEALPGGIAGWLDDGAKSGMYRSRYPGDPAADDPAASAVAMLLCCSHATMVSMTPRQREVFLTLAKLQLQCGLHSPLPNVMEELLWLARRPWWDGELAGIVEE